MVSHILVMHIIVSAGGQVASRPSQLLGNVSVSPIASQDAGEHCVPAGTSPFAGQVVVFPSQVAATSHPLPLAGRQVVPPLAGPFAGQVVVVPSQVAGTSHPLPLEGRQVVPALPGLFAGQAPEDPVQVACTSQGLPGSAVPHFVPFDTKASAGQAADEPVQVSGTSQAPFIGRQTAPFGLK